MNIIDPIMKALKVKGYVDPTPIQQEAIPAILQGRDILGCAPTGTGKTVAFAVPLLQLIHAEKKKANGPKVVSTLILTPTRELAIQIDESIKECGKFTGLRHTVIYGGVSQFSQVNALKAGVDIIVATPGRLLDLINQKQINLSNIKHFVLDEADRMLDMGFSHDMKKIIALLPVERQTLLFSATMPPEIVKLIEKTLNDPYKIEVAPTSSTVDTIKQFVYFVDRQDKKPLLIKLLKDKSVDTALVFMRTKHGADNLVKDLSKAQITAQAIHGDKSQFARQSALKNFKLRRTRVLVATDIAARGIDIEKLSHVINFDLPDMPETYVHRIGRTGRAGMDGIALSFCDKKEKEYLYHIQKLISKKIPVVS